MKSRNSLFTFKLLNSYNTFLWISILLLVLKLEPSFSQDDLLNSPSSLNVGFMLVAKDVPWWKDPNEATDEDHQAMQMCRNEHQTYLETLEGLGFYVESFQNAEDMSASMFVEDPAVVLGYHEGKYHVVITRVGSSWRTDEGDALKKYLEKRSQISDINPSVKQLKFKIYDMRTIQNATLDGGDVLRIKNHLYIGLSPHTNKQGAEYLAMIASQFGLIPHILPVPKGLHLKSSCSLAADNLIVYDADLASQELLELFSKNLKGYKLLAVEHLGSNVLFLGKAPKTGRNTVLVSAAAPKTAKILKEQYGLDVIILSRPCHEDLSGRLTCSSLRFPLAVLGDWST